MQTAVIFIRDWVRTNGDMSEDGESITYNCKDIESVIEQANKMFEEQIIESWIDGNSTLGYTTPEIYYNETYGSKGSDGNFKQFSLYEHKETITSADTIKSSQTEISDEEIQQEAIKYGWGLGFANSNGIYDAWVNACKWYREQLKKKQ